MSERPPPMPADDKQKLAEIRQYTASALVQLGRQQRQDILTYAYKGDWRPLICYLREGSSSPLGCRVTPEMRRLIADILEKRSRTKVGASAAYKRNWEVVKFILEARGRGEPNYWQKAEEKFKRTRRHLEKIWADKKLRNQVQDSMQWWTNAGIVRDAVARMAEGARVPPRYIVTRTATTVCHFLHTK
jgi:hypothetical protein